MDGRTLAPFALVAALVVAAPIGPAWAPQQPPQAAIPVAPVQPVVTPAKPAAKPVKAASAAELSCLAMNVYWESRGQPLSGQAAVAHVTLNRAAAPGFPASICGVVHQSCQFGWTCDGKSNSPTDPAAWDEAMDVAKRAVAGDPDPTGGALYFHHVQERPQWVRGRYGHRVVIGQHVFFAVKNESEPQLAHAPQTP